jgi:hypothetical protein
LLLKVPHVLANQITEHQPHAIVAFDGRNDRVVAKGEELDAGAPERLEVGRSQCVAVAKQLR